MPQKPQSDRYCCASVTEVIIYLHTQNMNFHATTYANSYTSASCYYWTKLKLNWSKRTRPFTPVPIFFCIQNPGVRAAALIRAVTWAQAGSNITHGARPKYAHHIPKSKSRFFAKMAMRTACRMLSIFSQNFAVHLPRKRPWCACVPYTSARTATWHSLATSVRISRNKEISRMARPKKDYFTFIDSLKVIDAKIINLTFEKMKRSQEIAIFKSECSESCELHAVTIFSNNKISW